MIDTHTHLNFPELASQLDSVLARAKENSVDRFIVPATDLETSLTSVALSAKYSSLYSCVGIHPCSAHGYNEVVHEQLITLLQGNQLVTSIGEVGLDYYHFDSLTSEEIEQNKVQQKLVFRDMIGLAKQFSLPVIIHSREAYKDTKVILSEVPEVRSVIHCFTGTTEQAFGWLEHGSLLSLTGIITYKKNSALRETVKQIPLEKIMLETDSPYLAPEGFRGEIGEPRFVRNVAQCIADIKGIDITEVAKVTTQTAEKFFKV